MSSWPPATTNAVPDAQPVMGGPEFAEQLYTYGFAAVPVPPVRVQLGNGGPCRVQFPRTPMKMVCGPTYVVTKSKYTFVAPTELEVLLLNTVPLVTCANAGIGSNKASQSSMRR